MAQRSLVTLPREDRLDFLAEDKIVRQTARATVACMKALETIYRRKLWREEFKSFDDYCRDRFDLSGSYMARKLKAEEMRVESVDGAVKNMTDHQLLALRSFRSELRDEIFKRAVDEAGGHDPSAPVIERVGRLVTDEHNGSSNVDDEEDDAEDESESECSTIDEASEEGSIDNGEVLAEVARRTAPPKLHPLQRAAEHHRLGSKDARHVVKEDMEDGSLREAAVKLIEELRKEIEFLTGLLAG